MNQRSTPYRTHIADKCKKRQLGGRGHGKGEGRTGRGGVTEENEKTIGKWKGKGGREVDIRI